MTTIWSALLAMGDRTLDGRHIPSTSTMSVSLLSNSRFSLSLNASASTGSSRHARAAGTTEIPRFELRTISAKAQSSLRKWLKSFRPRTPKAVEMFPGAEYSSTIETECPLLTRSSATEVSAASRSLVPSTLEIAMSGLAGLPNKRRNPAA